MCHDDAILSFLLVERYGKPTWLGGSLREGVGCPCSMRCARRVFGFSCILLGVFGGNRLLEERLFCLFFVLRWMCSTFLYISLVELDFEHRVRCVVMGVLALDLSLVKSVVFDSDVGKRLARCPFVCKVPLGRVRSSDVDWSWLRCSVDGGHCGFRGRRLRFESFGVDSLRVVWVCPKIVDLSFLRSDVHG